ncbi:ATP-binding cassette domain-containing protein [Christiangramia flava]|uniref:Putative molybdenum transport ATP-binding protein modF n=1 Tax=Christiangramia flava JLT2011 TaxID=1229726 RepID=A0A1L7I6F4_9FLAO|nr:ATP-binding cassette domain-containing protein [Christiangramia flava]APU68763.1 Putative molybdenum transport ATP-binding protein modF [Christiangramia flava JLT2011]OSS39092.1 ABC transporter, ATP-binding protein [Christiangramia flava JLT2011]
MTNHLGIDTSGIADVSWLKKRFSEGDLPENFKGKNILEFSESVLQHYLLEDRRHGNSILTPDNLRTFSSYSSGERRKMLLDHLLKQRPGVLILDEVFDCLDKESIPVYIQKFINVKEEISFIQFFRKKEDRLAFIEQVKYAEEFVDPRAENQLSKASEKPAHFELPPPINQITAPEVLVDFKNVNLHYSGKDILRNISWQVRKNEFWQISGPNGAGKSTLLDMIYGNNPKAYGTDLEIFGNRKGSGETIWELREKMGFFSPSMIDLFTRRNTVLEMLVSGMVDSVGLYQQPSGTQLRCAGEWLKILGFSRLSSQVFIELPETEKRLILIARAMIKHPPLLILDEPTAGLDAMGIEKLVYFVNSIAANSETTILYVSHRPEKELQPDAELRLVPSSEGSTGEVLRFQD